jgi:chaperone BCS1
MGIGVVLTGLRRSVNLAGNLAQRRLLVTLEIPSKDRAYPWFLEWMAIQSKKQKQVSAPSSSTGSGLVSRWKQLLNGSVPVQSHQLAVETTYKKHDNGSTEALFTLVPGPGTHYFRYQGAWIQLKRERDSKLMDLHSGIPWETVTLTTLSKDRYLFPKLLKEARELADREKEGKTVVYTAWGAEWRPFGKPRRKREVGSVVLADGMGERLETDLRTFLGRGKWYADRGEIPSCIRF